jgi:hypothetical protein
MDELQEHVHTKVRIRGACYAIVSDAFQLIDSIAEFEQECPRRSVWRYTHKL